MPTMTIEANESTVIFLFAYEKEVTKEHWNSLTGRNAAAAFKLLSLKTVPPVARFQGSSIELITYNQTCQRSC